MSKLEAPTNLVINSMTDSTITCDVNITFSYNGKTGLDGATNAVLGYSTTNDSSKAYYDTNTYATVEAGSNTRTVQIPSTSAPHFVPTNGKKYYFWLKVTSAANNLSDSAWSNVAEFIANKISVTESVNYYFLTNDNETVEIHKKLLKKFLSKLGVNKVSEF